MGHRREHPVDCLDWADTKGAYRFFSNDRVSHLTGHFQSTRDRVAVDRSPTTASNLDQHARDREFVDAHQGARWPRFAKVLLPDRIDPAAVTHVNKVHSHLQYVPKFCLSRVQDCFQVDEDLARSSSYIPTSHQLPRTIQRGYPGHKQ